MVHVVSRFSVVDFLCVCSVCVIHFVFAWCFVHTFCTFAVSVFQDRTVEVCDDDCNLRCISLFGTRRIFA